MRPINLKMPAALLMTVVALGAWSAAPAEAGGRRHRNSCDDGFRRSSVSIELNSFGSRRGGYCGDAAPIFVPQTCAPQVYVPQVCVPQVYVPQVYRPCEPRGIQFFLDVRRDRDRGCDDDRSFGRYGRHGRWSRGFGRHR